MASAQASTVHNYPADYVFTALLKRDSDGNPVVEEECYVFELTEDSTNINVPMGSLDLTSESVMVGFIPNGYNQQYSLELRINNKLVPAEEALELCEEETSIEQDVGQEGSGDAYWNEEATKLLISLYPIYREKVAARQIKSQAKMWGPLATEINKKKYCYTATQCNNKWKTLERSYKKKIDNNNKTGRGRKTCAFETQLNEIFTKRANIFPEVVMGTGPPRTKEMLLKQCLTEETDEVAGPSHSHSTSAPSTSFPDGDGCQRQTTAAKTKKSMLKPVRERSRSVASELKSFRREMAEAREAREKATNDREERKLKVLEERNQLIKRTNELLEMLIKDARPKGDN